MSNATYYRRQAQGRCVYCGGEPRPGHVGCQRCAERFQGYYDQTLPPAHRTFLQRYRGVKAKMATFQSQASPHTGPMLGHCGTFQAIRTLPFRCAVCGTTFFEESIP